MVYRPLSAHWHHVALISIAVALLLALAPAASARAEAPANDNWQDATVVTSLSFSTSQDTSEATVSADERYRCQVTDHTVWFSYTPARNTWLVANTFGSDFDTVLAVWTRNPSTGIWSAIACSDNYEKGKTSSLSSRTRFRATAGTTYYFQVGGYLGESGNLSFNLGRH